MPCKFTSDLQGNFREMTATKSPLTFVVVVWFGFGF
jgi:hypothetical protein